MSNFNDAVARMKALYTYGTINEDSNKQSNYTLEFTKKAADGKFYGIVKECNHYYIKQSVDGKQNIAESYEYIGGFMNKKNYQYDSYANALKNLELKLASINEAHDGKINISTLDPFKKEDLVIESTDAMKNEIARQRQIMYNASMLMNESIGFNNTGVPEAPKGSNDEDKPFVNVAKASLDKDPKFNSEKPENQSEPFGDGSAPEKGKDVKDSDIASDGKAVAAEHPSGGKVVRVNEECEDGKCDWGSEGLDKGEDPKSIGWDMEGDKPVNEEDEKEWGSEGLPADSDAGIGSPDGHLMEDDEAEDEDDFDEFSDDDYDIEDDEEDELDDELADDEILDDELADEEPAVEDEPAVDDEVLADDEVAADDDIAAKIADLEAQLAALKAQINADEEPAVEDEPAVDDEEPAVEDEPAVDDDAVEGDDVSADAEVEDELDDEDDFDDDSMFESKKNVLNNIVESVVKSFLNEDELHVFGDHPGYRKKPMDLPPTGEDKNEHGEDWNDESAHSEEPFGKQIGDSSPFNDLVDAVTKDVMYQLKHGAPLDNKKKVD